MRGKPDEEDPLGFEGPEIIKCKGYITGINMMLSMKYGVLSILSVGFVYINMSSAPIKLYYYFQVFH